jgi:hypothetical protein
VGGWWHRPTNPPARRQTAAGASRVAAVWRGLRLTLCNQGNFMRTKFWRFAYKEEALTAILASSSLVFPDLSRWPQAKNCSEEAIICDLRVGHFVLLANFNSTAETGTVRGVGKIESIENSTPKVQWKKPVPSWVLNPDPRGGVAQWNKEGVFCFDVNPAKRYKLDALTKKLFPEN